MAYQTPLQRMSKIRYVVGIDPDKNESGFACWDHATKKYIEVRKLFFAALQEACFRFEKDEVIFYVEAGWLNKGANKYQSETLPKDFDTWSRERKDAYIFQRGTDVGINFGAGFAITHVLRANGYTVKHWPPRSAKWDAAELKLQTGITGRTNQDMRDAVRAIFYNK